MKIVIIGGTGLIGSKLVEKLNQSRHTVVAASKAAGINSISGEGLYKAVEDATVVIDVINSSTFEGKTVIDFFQRSTINLLTAEAYAGVKHHITLSMVGADRLPASDYLRAKLAQEELVKNAGVPYTILRSTQFYEFVPRITDLGAIGEEIHISPAAVQPIAADEVVDTLFDIAHTIPINKTIEVAGPERMPMSEFIRYYMDATEDPRQLVEDEHASFLGTELNDHSLVPHKDARVGSTTYQDWFHRQLVNY